MMIDPIELTRELIRFNTINPPGNETPCAEHIGGILERAGFSIAYHPMEDGRANLIARIGGVAGKKPLCMSGHTDVVPLGAAPWSVAPFAADIADGKIFGRGSTDMKGGVAAIVAAAVELAPRLEGTPGLVLVITAGEERGCQGANFLVQQPGVLGEAGALLVAEPTSNRPLNGHKGVLWIEGRATGVTAHGSTPEHGVNAVYKAARVIGRLEGLKLEDGRVLKGGLPTLNVGWFHGGMNINSIPDEAKFGLDIRMVPGLTDTEVLAQLAEIGGKDVAFTRQGYSEPVFTEPSDPWIASVHEVMAEITGERHAPGIATYFTDAAALTKAYGNPPTIILGPGEAEMAHQTDEFCYIRRIEEATAGFTEIAKRWCGV
ncbi:MULTISPECIES: M20 family metallopeptidase [Rhodomicrobium]|uniref:M20 family metallopeptidase n=1 Tax=Rhodomicrobium TaxID=1068 RepID=UPI001FDA9DC7|nr:MULTISPECIES: M20 family metallopeptidase [Rhodomicrobium]